MTSRSHSSISTKCVVGALSMFSFASRAEAQDGLVSARPFISRELEANTEEFVSSAELVGLCARIERDLISYGEIPESQRHQPKVLLSCMKSTRCASKALQNLSAQDLLNDEVAGIVASGNIAMDWSRLHNPCIGQSPRVRELFEELLAAREFEEIQPANVYPTLQQYHNSPELASKMREYALAYITDRLSNPVLRVADADIPVQLFSEEEFVSLVSPLVPLRPSVEQVRVLQYVSPSVSALTKVLGASSIEPIVALRGLRSSNLVEPILSEVISLFEARPAEAIRAALESGSEVLREHPQIRDRILREIARDARVAPDLDKLFTSPPDQHAARAAVGGYLNSETTIKRLMRDVRVDLATLADYPKDILQAPEIRHAALERINWMLLYKTALRGGPEQLRVLVERYFDVLPDVVGLIRSDEELEACKDLLSDIVLVNPRANQHLAPYMNSIPAEYSTKLGKVVRALDVLGVNGIGRFHNAREIIINRYHAGTPDERKQIDEILGDEPLFTRGTFSLRSRSRLDTRPVCVVALCEPDTDFNRVFNAKESFGGRDDLDQLTTRYKVVYFEPSGADQAIRDVMRASAQLGRKVELLFLGGHGACDGVTLSCGVRAMVTGQARISTEHKAELESLRSVLAEGAKVPLLSCSVAASVDGQSSFAQILHEALPHVTVYGPDNDTNGQLLFDSSARFKEIVFSNANRLAFLPHTNSPVVEAGPSRAYDQIRYSLGLMAEHPSATAWVVGFAALFLASSYDAVRGIVRSYRARRSRRVDGTTAPSDP